MRSSPYLWIVTVFLVINGVCVMDCQYLDDGDYFDSNSDEYPAGLYSNRRPKKFFLSNQPRSSIISLTEPSITQTECITPGDSDDTTTAASAPAPASESGSENQPPPPGAVVSSSASVNEDSETKAKELRNLVQHLYIAQARVQLEATEIKKAQAVANSAQQALEEAANHVRTITAALQNSQQEVASAAIRAQTAQLQLAAHDQLLFAARQDVDALSSQMVGLQAAEGISQPKITVDLTGLLDKLKQPLSDAERPTAVPSILPFPATGRSREKVLVPEQQTQRQLQVSRPVQQPQEQLSQSLFERQNQRFDLNPPSIYYD
uniref:Uncharacterized protein n=1 Tax=Glossina brevipalpis TaxID=37001 RepID=A0A1A9WB36_9MUSC